MLNKAIIIFSVFILLINFIELAEAQEIKPDLYVDFIQIKSLPSDILPKKELISNEAILINDNAITWQVYIPKTTDPSLPPGLIVYTSPGLSIISRYNWAKIAEENNLIWAYAERSGRPDTEEVRVLLAGITVPLIKQKLEVNIDRIYAVGEGRITSKVMSNNPISYKGAIYSGEIMWNDKDEAKAKMMVGKSFVFIKSTDEKKSLQMERTLREYNKADVKNTQLILLDESSHLFVKKRRLNQAIKFLDKSEK